MVIICIIFFSNASEHPVPLICLTVDMACLKRAKLAYWLVDNNAAVTG